MEKRIRKKIRKRMRKEKSKDIQTEYSFIRILAGSDLSRRRLPIMMMKSKNPGPVLWLNACVHGDEVGGMVIIQEIFKKIQKKLLKGKVYAFPLMNPMGFENESKYVSFSEEDLNRSFPGDEDGSLAERIAKKIFTIIKGTNPALVLDLHNDWRKSIQYTLIDPFPGLSHNEAYEITKVYSKKIGFPMILDVKPENTLTYSLLKQDIPAITLELGESNAVNERDVKTGVNSIMNILNYLGMVDEAGEKIISPLPENLQGKILRYSEKPASPTSGIIRFLVKPGDIIKKGEEIAKIYNAFGKLLETLKALDDAIVLGYSDSSVAFPGAPVMAFGVV